ncbi:uncharacterized protein LOC114261204 isoform X2 [Camellia sinensis]|uniref:uncharacterized protein LOC114261204 isoform X2 n=1 Tax=Camellia sinensis TaxID=4442 RepID=UPI001036C1A6|nr:uncharacterized protein LOC114261204 isoform X2 [Camellia sinensis]
MESEKATNETLVSEAEANQEPTLQQNSQLDEEEEEEDVEDEVGVDEIGISKSTSLDQKEILSALEVVERDSVAIADSFTSLFASLRLALSEVTSTSVDHMRCFSDAAGRLQECVSGRRLSLAASTSWLQRSCCQCQALFFTFPSLAQLPLQKSLVIVAKQQLVFALDAATKGNRYINSCLRLNEEIKGMDSLATQLKILRKNVDTLDSAVNRLLRLP